MKKFKLPICLFLLLFTIFICKIQAYSNIDEVPVDIVYKYIDLTDPNLKRDGIPTDKKSIDNEELKFSIRSVIKNIQWVRKIFIIMPNDKVSYFKDISLISDKIVYIKDKDLLGFDSASSITFEHNGLYKLDEFGVSENFIYMCDDYFIGKPLKKSDFFYIKNNEAFPYVLYSSKCLSNGMYNEIEKSYSNLKPKMNNKFCSHTYIEYFFQTYSAFKLLYKIFDTQNITLIKSFSTLHNATPFKISDLKELRNMVKKYYENYEDCFLQKLGLIFN